MDPGSTPKGLRPSQGNPASRPLPGSAGPSAYRIPEPPDRIEFSCPCGKILSAPRPLYDRRSKCGACHTVLLLNLVYKRDLDRFEIDPFRIGGALGA